MYCRTNHSAQDLAAQVAHAIAQQLRDKPDSVIVLPTGSTPIPVYDYLIRMHREWGLDFSQATFFNLDEYVGLGPDHPQSYHNFMQKHFFGHVNNDPSRTHIPNGLAADIEEECRAYEDKIRAAGGIDLAFLGMGGNGHIAFNEPGSPLDSRTRVVDLDGKTITDNARFFESASEVPTQAITMGLATIREAARIIMMVTGEKKADTVHRLFTGGITSDIPASVLHFHPDAYVYLDGEAASRLVQEQVSLPPSGLPQLTAGRG